MTRNTYFIIGLVLVFIIAGLVFIKQRGGNEALAPTNGGSALTSPTPQSPTSTPTSPPASETTSPTSQTPSSKAVTYTASGFSPQSLTIKTGDTVVFKNTSGSDFWPASGPHPAHTNYPEFDAKKAISTGESYLFTFTRTGSWKYHNHLNPSLTGTITVQ